MNNLLVMPLSSARDARRGFAAALICTAILFAMDIHLYHAGQSWTPLHYESLAPLLALGYPRLRLQLISTLGATLMVGTATVLYFTFGLTSQLAAESWLFVGGAVLALIAWLMPLATSARHTRWLPVGFLAASAALLISDKALSNDMLASAYLPHFLKLNAGAKVTPSTNPVYASLKHRLSPGHGGVLVVFEALGSPNDKVLVKEIEQDYQDFDVITPEFEGGSTVPAEIRYLCGLNGNISDYSTCLPHVLPSRAMHGNSLSYFNRHLLYRNMGFGHLAGKHELAELDTCRFSYSAVCDQAMWDRLLKDVRSTKCREFHYVLSIDSHFPYTKYTKHAAGLLGDLRQLLDVMRQIKQEFPDCEIVIAGDHPPPLAPGFNNHQVLVVTARR
ncbi:hypothetical protein [Roseateles sp.]|uniref:hypothetical protein n=1 Tax=Roseateles sp. TaxID=1971397 RepID=UPI003BA64CF1